MKYFVAISVAYIALIFLLGNLGFRQTETVALMMILLIAHFWWVWLAVFAFLLGLWVYRSKFER